MIKFHAVQIASLLQGTLFQEASDPKKKPESSLDSTLGQIKQPIVPMKSNQLIQVDLQSVKA